MRNLLSLILLVSVAHATAQVVINEVDYDQPGTDGAEFIEIKNIGGSAFPLQYLSVVLVNGAGDAPVIYQTISSPSWPALEPGDYFVICGNSLNTPACDAVADVAINLVQNGPADAIQLELEDAVQDVLAYGGNVTGYTEGTGTTAIDVNALDDRSLSRWPDGADTNNNDADFRLGCSTPGAPNQVDSVLCAAPNSVREIAVANVFTVNMDAAGQQLAVRWQGTSKSAVRFELFDATGSLIATRSVGGGAERTWNFSTRSLPTGLLLVRATDADRQQVRRIVLR
ncbi:MAG: lamin tail domain-containing protein [Flavobacteriales bacterium]|nr:lamin tail domain-containing protein [Flavobacteriales bacterium]